MHKTTTEFQSLKFKQILDSLKELSPEQKLEIGKWLWREAEDLNIVFNGNGNGNGNVISNSVVIQVSDSSKEITEQLLEKIKVVSPEALEEFLIAIAHQIKSRAESQNNTTPEG